MTKKYPNLRKYEAFATPTNTTTSRYQSPNGRFMPTWGNDNFVKNLQVEVVEERLFEVKLVERELDNLEHDLGKLQEMTHFFHENPQLRYEFEKWQTMDLLRRPY